MNKESNIRLNEVTIDTLFDQYNKIGFIYPTKKELLAPYFEQITKNWEALLNSEEDLLWVLDNVPNERKDFASVSFWRQSNYGLIAQHLVSNGNGLMPLKVMMEAQRMAEQDYTENEVKSGQNWFRPDNRYAFRVFASMFEKLGEERASLMRFQYLHLPFEHINMTAQNDFVVEEVTGIDLPFINFVKQQYNNVFVRAEELDTEDIQLTALAKKYQNAGLDRSRKILKIKDVQTGEIVSAIVANRAPLGLNFSFLENRAYYILDKNMDEKKRARVVSTMNTAIQPYYSDIELQALPIVTDEATSIELQHQKATFFKEYMQSIWLREGFAMWYEHIYSFLAKVEARWKARLAA